MIKSILLFFCFFGATQIASLIAQECYSSDYVEISGVTYNNDEYDMVWMRRGGERVKAKYFASDGNFSSVYERYLDWKRTNNIHEILLSSGTYFNLSHQPVGLTIDDGEVVNRNMVNDRMDALVVVYPNGGIAVSNLEDGNLSVGCFPGERLDLRGSTIDLYRFVECAGEMNATVFQSHLLVFENQLKVAYNADPTERERRFLAVGRDENGEIIHLIVHRPDYASLYEGAKKTLAFLNEYKYMDVIFMINLDTGYQDIFKLQNPNCTINSSIKGPVSPSEAANLLVYYYE